MPASSLGAYTFVSMSPAPVLAGERVAVEARAGVDGLSLWRTGAAGAEYQVETVRDVASWAAAVALADLYRATHGAGPFALVYGGISRGNVEVLSVEAQPEAIVSGHGGLAGTSAALVRARWRLIAV